MPPRPGNLTPAPRPLEAGDWNLTCAGAGPGLWLLPREPTTLPVLWSTRSLYWDPEPGMTGCWVTGPRLAEVSVKVKHTEPSGLELTIAPALAKFCSLVIVSL